MSKFDFKLQSVLNIKEKFEDQKKMELVNVNQKLNEEKNNLLEIQKQNNQQVNSFKNSISGSLKVVDILTLNKSVKHTTELIQEQQLKIASIKNQVERKKEELKQALVQRKTYEKLRKNEYASYLKELNSKEAKQVDEFVSFKYNNI